MEAGEDPPARRRGPRGLRRALAVGGAVVVLWLLVFEVALRLLPIPAFERAELMPSFLATQSGFRGQPHPYLAFTPTPDWSNAPDKPRQISHNEHGVRGPSIAKSKEPGVFRIVCLGGSSTYGASPSSDATTWPAQLQVFLNEGQDAARVEVINAGFLGYSTFESLANLAFRMLDFGPDLVIVYQTINDMKCALYRDDPQGDNTHWRAVWPIYRPTPTERLLEKSMTYLILRRYCTSYIRDVGDMGVWGIVGYDPDGPNAYVTGEPADVGFVSFQRNLVSLQAVARAHGADVVFASQGCLREDIAGPAEASQLAGLDRMENILRTVASEREILFVEGRRALDEAAATEGIDAVYTETVHLTDRGCEVLARALADAILERGMIR